MEIPGFGFAVAPIDDCPHTDRLRLSQISIPVLPGGQPPCEACGDTSENWLCLECLDIYCSRYVASHMAKHAAEQHSNQTLALSLSDHSFWCYTCDDYVSTPRLEGWLRSVCESQLSGDEDEVAPKGKERIGVAPGASSPTSSESDGAEDKYGDEDGDEDEDDYVTATPESVAAMLANGEVRNIVVVAGAGISTSAGIPDYRSEGGLYQTLHKYGVDPGQLAHPTQVFELQYFRENPGPFWAITRDLFYSQQTRPKPTPCHWFLRLLHDKGMLRRVYTQNIDGLELDAGVPAGVVMQAHGGNQAAHCIECGRDADVKAMEAQCLVGEIPRCGEAGCAGLVKPAVVLFGEGLPHRMFQLLHDDREAGPDMVLVLGTSLKVGPVNMIPSLFPRIPRVLVNRELVGDFDAARDCCLLGDIDEQVQQLAQRAGWSDELQALIDNSNAP